MISRIPRGPLNKTRTDRQFQNSVYKVHHHLRVRVACQAWHPWPSSETSLKERSPHAEMPTTTAVLVHGSSEQVGASSSNLHQTECPFSALQHLELPFVNSLARICSYRRDVVVAGGPHLCPETATTSAAREHERRLTNNHNYIEQVWLMYTYHLG